MKSSELIKKLLELDPGGEMEIMLHGWGSSDHGLVRSEETVSIVRVAPSPYQWDHYQKYDEIFPPEDRPRILEDVYEFVKYEPNEPLDDWYREHGREAVLIL